MKLGNRLRDFVWLMRKLGRESLETIRRPRRLRWLFSADALRRQMRMLVRKDAPSRLVDKSLPWTKAPGEARGLKRREFTNYADYVKLQREKLSIIDLDYYDREFRCALKNRLRSLRFVVPGKSCVCLAARIGTEVKAFTDLGLLAVGIDLNPGDGNQYVLHGDFHALQFADSVVDIVYTNSLDHALELERLLSEVTRVLKDDGSFMVEAMKGTATPEEFGVYETLWWETVDSLIAAISKEGFELQQRSSFTYPWDGEQLVFSRV